MKKKKPFAYRTTTKQLAQNIQRDFIELTSKNEMVSVGELTDERGKAYMVQLYSFLDKCRKNFNDDFIIEVFRWIEVGDRKMTRSRWRQALAVPTPRPGRAYYYYDASEQTLDLLWDLPPQKACEWGYKNKEVIALNHPDALKTILDYYDGTLVKKANEINKKIVEHRSSYNARRTQETTGAS